MNYRRDVSDQYADANDAALSEVYAADWPDDDAPTRAEVERDENGPDYFDFDWRAEQLRGWGNDR